MAKNDQKNVIEKDNHPQKRSIPWKVRLLLLCIVLAACGYGYYQGKIFLSHEVTPLDQKLAVENKINIKIKTLEQRITELEKVVSNLQAEKNLSPDLEKRFNELRHDTLAQIDQKFSDQSQGGSYETTIQPATREVLLASGAMIVRDLAEKGLPFAYEAEVLKILTQGNEQAQKYADTIQKYASFGLYGKEHLITQFDKIYPTLGLSASAPVAMESQDEDLSSDAAWQTKIWQWIKKITLHHKKKPQPKFDENTDRVYVLVNEARFAEALQLIKTDENYTAIESPTLSEWIKTTQTYLDFETAISGLIVNSLANIHLKEFEH